MNLLVEILSSRVRAELFRLFFGLDHPEMHLREIERQSGFSIGSVRQEATKLVKHGLLIKRTDGNRTYYSANRQSAIFPEIHSLVMKTVGLVDLFVSVLDIPEIQIAFVFGSIAKDTAGPKSDIDLFVIGDVGLRFLSKRLMEVKNKVGREINVHSMTQAEFVNRRDANDHFVVSVVSSPHLMIIGDMNELASLV